METNTTSITLQPANVVEAIKPFEPDDRAKGTFLVLRIAGMEQSTTLSSLGRKYRSWQYWRATDEDFYRLDEQIPILAARFGGEARVLRTALLDISIIEAGIHIFRRVLGGETVNSDMWSYAVKLAGLRMPMMGAKESSGSPWERLANSITNTISQRELTVTEQIDGTKLITARELIAAKEVSVQPSPEQRQMANGIVEQMLNKAKGELGEKIKVGSEVG